MLITAPARTDDELLLSGDPEDFAAFYRRHARWVAGFHMRRVRDPELAADLTAETFAAALRARARYRPGDGSASPWLHRIASNLLVDAVRKRQAEDRAQRALGMQRVPLTVQDHALFEELELVRELPDDQRRAVVARVVEDRDYDAIARDEHVSEAVVRKRVSRGLAALRERMRGERP